MAFGGMPDLSHRNPSVYAELLKLERWLIEEIGFDGFRYDFVKGYGANTITAMQEYRYMRDGKPMQPYGVAEFWDNARAIENWVDLANFSSSNPVDAFDFPMREMLRPVRSIWVRPQPGAGSCPPEAAAIRGYFRQNRLAR
jgi:alpha-amylase